MSSFYNEYLNKKNKNNTTTGVIKMPNVIGRENKSLGDTLTSSKPQSAWTSTTLPTPDSLAISSGTSTSGSKTSSSSTGSSFRPISAPIGKTTDSTKGKNIDPGFIISPQTDVSKPTGKITAETVAGWGNKQASSGKTPSAIRTNIERKAKKKSGNGIISFFDDIDDDTIKRSVQTAKDAIKNNIDRGLLSSADLEKYPDMEDGMTMFYAASEKNKPKAARTARDIAYTQSDPTEFKIDNVYSEPRKASSKVSFKADDYNNLTPFAASAGGDEGREKFQTDNYYKGFNRVTLPFMEENKDEAIKPLKVEDDRIVTKKMMDDFGWPITDEELDKLNGALEKYGITDMNSVRLFMATCAHESGFGSASLEKLKKDGTTVGVYTPEERGAGYIQITWDDTHKAFLESVGDSYDGKDTATYISKNYPWEAAAWFWTNSSAKNIWDHTKGKYVSLNEYAATVGDSMNAYLVIQMKVNGVPKYVDSDKTMPRSIQASIADGSAEWSIKRSSKNGNVYILTVDGVEFYAPKNWFDDTTGREDTYYSAMNAFK